MEELFKKYLHRVSVQPLFIRLNGVDSHDLSLRHLGGYVLKGQTECKS